MYSGSATSPRTVTGYQYVSRSVSISGGDCNDKTNILFPAYKVEVSNGGTVYRSETISSTVKARPLIKEYLKKRESNGRQYDEEEIRAGIQNIEKEAADKVEAPAELVEQIDALLVERKALEDRQNAINESLKIPSAQVFSKIK